MIEPKNYNEDLWEIDFDKFSSLFSEKTKILILNSPHNPTGKIFTYEEYVKIKSILEKYPKVLVISDEVYYNLAFNNNKFVSFIDIPGMF